jgi:glutamate racemase
MTVVRAVREALPNEHIVYFGDTARVPYGIKGKETIRRYAIEDAHFLMRFAPKLIVVACNTASAAALGEIAASVAVPVIGVIEPGALAAANASSSGLIGVLATESTVESRAYEEAITRLKKDARVISKACPLFVPMVEEGRVNGSVVEMVADEYLASFKPLGVDTIVLGCTHYPVLKPVIAKVAGEGVRIVDSAEETASAVRRVLNERELASSSPSARTEFFASDNPERFRRLAGLFLGAAPCSVTLVEPEDFFRKD